jgi:NAD(P)-dependent dehydrogenase (short-subunit alcohol dehydrogenase family)
MAQRVLVTAGASGIGREIARAFRESGATVFVCDIDAKALDALNQEMPGMGRVSATSRRGRTSNAWSLRQLRP